MEVIERPGLLDERDRLLAALLVEVAADDERPLLSELQGRGLTLPTPGAGDERDLALQVAHCW